jgi:hypothetical protein
MDARQTVEEMDKVREYHFVFEDTRYKVIVKYQIWAHGEWAALLYRIDDGQRYSDYLAACKSKVSADDATLKAVGYATWKQLGGV